MEEKTLPLTSDAIIFSPVYMGWLKVVPRFGEFCSYDSTSALPEIFSQPGDQPSSASISIGELD